MCFKPPGPAFLYFLGYLLVYGIFGVIQEEKYDEAKWLYFFTFLQLLVLFWVSKNLMAYEGLAYRALLTLGFSCLSLAVIGWLGIGANDMAQGRITVSDLNPNAYSAVLSIGLLALSGLAVSHQIGNSRIRVIAWLSVGILALAIVRSGSRGSVVSLFVALLTLLV